MNPQPPAAPITPAEIAALRDAMEKATPGDLNTLADARLSAFAVVLTPKLLAALDAAEAAIAEIHRTLGRGDGHGSTKATADCVISGIAALKERVAEAEAEIARLKAGGCARDQRTTQYCAEAVAANAKAVEFAWELLGLSERDGELYDDCKASLPRKAAEYLAERGLLRKVCERTWQRVEGK